VLKCYRYTEKHIKVQREYVICCSQNSVGEGGIF
jgi:hypothetical protein